jgi:hypothetical protein
MKRHLLKLAILGAIAVPALSTTPAQAQATRTWVSGVGDDVNPCSRTAPCKTFAGAISKTAANGKINCLDPGGFGAVSITKAIEIDCLQFPGGILSSGTNGVIVNAPANAHVILRGFEIHGGGNGLNGVRILSGSIVTIDKLFITAMTGNGIDISLTAAGTANVTVLDTVFQQMNNGINISATGGGAALVRLHNSTINKVTATGVALATSNTFATVSNSLITGNTTGASVANGAQLNMINTVVTYHTTGLTVAAGGTARITGNTFLNNSTSTTNSGTLATGGNNKIEPAGAAPNATITNQ